MFIAEFSWITMLNFTFCYFERPISWTYYDKFKLVRSSSWLMRSLLREKILNQLNVGTKPFHFPNFQQSRMFYLQRHCCSRVYEFPRKREKAYSINRLSTPCEAFQGPSPPTGFTLWYYCSHDLKLVWLFGNARVKTVTFKHFQFRNAWLLRHVRHNTCRRNAFHVNETREGNVFTDGICVQFAIVKSTSAAEEWGP